MTAAGWRRLRRGVLAVLAFLGGWGAACAPPPPAWHASLEEIPRPVGEAGFEEEVREDLRELRRAWEEARAGRDRVAAAEAAGRLGMWLHAYRDFPAASAAYRNARRLAPAEARWAHYHGRVLRREGDLEAAREAFRAALERAPGDGPTLARLAELELLAGRPEAAASLLADHAGAGDPPFLVYLAGRAAFEAGDSATAVPLLERALREAPGAPAVHQVLGLACRELGRDEEARGHLEAAAEGAGAGPLVLDDPRMAAVHALRAGAVELARAGRAALQEGRTAEAVETLTAAAERAPERADVRIQLARALLRRGRPLEAERILRQAVELEPELPGARLALGGLLAREGSLVAAETELREAHRLDPDSFEAAWQLAEVLRRTARCGDAVPLYRRAAALDPSRPDVVYEEVLCLLHLGRRAEARERLDETLGSFPGHPGHPGLSRLVRRLEAPASAGGD